MQEVNEMLFPNYPLNTAEQRSPSNRDPSAEQHVLTREVSGVREHYL